MELSNREKSLIDRGYSRGVVESLCYLDENKLKEIEDRIYNDIIIGASSVSKPYVTYIGGQPGSGKSVISMRLKRISNAVEIGIDNYRMYHPNYLSIEKTIRAHWKDREVTFNDSPGNDIADFTHNFSGMMTDRLIDRVSKEKYNILLEWSMRNPNQIINSVNEFKHKEYSINLNVLAVNKDVSLNACHLRSDGMNEYGHIVRRVPDSFHEMCINDLPDSINKIYEEISNKVNKFYVIDRDGSVIWDSRCENLPGNILRDIINKDYTFENIKNDVKWAVISYEKESLGLRFNYKKNNEFSGRKMVA